MGAKAQAQPLPCDRGQLPPFWNALNMRESTPRKVDKKSGVPEEEKGVWGSQGGIGVWNSQGGGKDKHFFFFSTFLSLSHIKRFFL